jgi:5'/3'-nucleotidase SurE
VGKNDMNILITNDDGIYSPGIAALAKAAINFGEVRIMAPDVERSSASHAITSHLPISYKKANINVDGVQSFKVNGTPQASIWAPTWAMPCGIQARWQPQNKLFC